MLRVKASVKVAANFSADHGDVTALFIPFSYDGSTTLAPRRNAATENTRAGVVSFVPATPAALIPTLLSPGGLIGAHHSPGAAQRCR